MLFVHLSPQGFYRSERGSPLRASRLPCVDALCAPPCSPHLFPQGLYRSERGSPRCEHKTARTELSSHVRQGNPRTLVLLSRFFLLKPRSSLFLMSPAFPCRGFMPEYLVVLPRKRRKMYFQPIGSRKSDPASLNLLLQHQEKSHVRIVCLCRSLDSCGVLCVGRTFEKCSHTELLHWLNTWSKSGSKGPNSFFLVGREFTDVLRHLALDGFPTLFSAVKTEALKGIF